MKIFVSLHLRDYTKIVTFAPMIEKIIFIILIILGIFFERKTRRLK